MQPHHRRRFLAFSMGAAGSLGLGAALWRDSAGNDADGRIEVHATEGGHAAVLRSYALGTQVSVTVIHRRASVARDAAAEAMARITQVDRLMSLYRPDSPLSRLNREGVLRRPHPWLVELLGQCRAFSRRTGGALDVTVQPLWRLRSDAHRAGQAPEPDAIAAALRNVDWRRVAVSPRKIELLGRGTAVTLNGIAQGYAADRAMAALRRLGVRHALVDAGEIGTIGSRPGRPGWAVGVQHPRREDAFVALAGLRGRCLATSGDYATKLDEDFGENHLVEPRTGRSPRHFASVTVAARSATEADALSTALFVLEPSRGLELIGAIPGADSLLVFKDGRVLATGGFPTPCPAGPEDEGATA